MKMPGEWKDSTRLGVLGLKTLAVVIQRTWPPDGIIQVVIYLPLVKEAFNRQVLRPDYGFSYS